MQVPLYYSYAIFYFLNALSLQLPFKIVLIDSCSPVRHSACLLYNWSPSMFKNGCVSEIRLTPQLFIRWCCNYNMPLAVQIVVCSFIT